MCCLHSLIGSKLDIEIYKMYTLALVSDRPDWKPKWVSRLKCQVTKLKGSCPLTLREVRREDTGKVHKPLLSSSYKKLPGVGWGLDANQGDGQFPCSHFTRKGSWKCQILFCYDSTLPSLCLPMRPTSFSQLIRTLTLWMKYCPIPEFQITAIKICMVNCCNFVFWQ